MIEHHDVMSIGMMNGPVKAHVIHMDSTDPMKMHAFLRQLRTTLVAQGNEERNVVLLADKHLGGREVALRVLHKAVVLTGFKVVGVVGELAKVWACVMNVAEITGKPHGTMDMRAIAVRTEKLAKIKNAGNNSLVAQATSGAENEEAKVGGSTSDSVPVDGALVEGTEDNKHLSAEQPQTVAPVVDETLQHIVAKSLAHVAEVEQLGRAKFPVACNPVTSDVINLDHMRQERMKLEQERQDREEKARQAERLEAERVEAERLEQERMEAERLEAERLEQERLEQERMEAERLEAERLEAERLEAERLEAERLEAERLEVERLEAERLEQERLETERMEAERMEAERLEQERMEAERLQEEERMRAQEEMERVENERIEQARVELAQAEARQRDEERIEQERIEQELMEMARLQEEQDRLAYEEAVRLDEEERMEQARRREDEDRLAVEELQSTQQAEEISLASFLHGSTKPHAVKEPQGEKEAEALVVNTPMEQVAFEQAGKPSKMPEERVRVVVVESIKPQRIQGRVRSGQVITHAGDVIIEGSVHAGGEIVASGDIHVYGNAGGRLLAGVTGDTHACIYVQHFDAEMICIAGKYHIFEDVDPSWVGKSIKISLFDHKLVFEAMDMPKMARVA